MTQVTSAARAAAQALPRAGWPPAPLLRAPETSGTIFRVTTLAALAPLGAGLLFFGYRAAILALLSVVGCVGIEGLYFRITRAPALADRRHAVLTGVLLALTLPPHAAWYVPLVGAAFAILIGKAIFGGVGHFLWQPALVGRLAIAGLFALPVLNPAQPSDWPLLAPPRIFTGDVTDCRPTTLYQGWDQTPLPAGGEGFLLPRPVQTLRGLTHGDWPVYGSVLEVFGDLPPIRDLLLGATPGGLGETSALIILLAGLYLVYRHYVPAVLVMAMVTAAAFTVAIAPIQLLGPTGTVRLEWLPITLEPLEHGFAYVSYHLCSGELLLAAFFLAPEMTSRPVTPRGQLVFGLGCGVLAMLLRLYGPFPLSGYLAVLVMNTFTPVLERLTRPRVLGRPPLWQRMLGGPRYLRR